MTNSDIVYETFNRIEGCVWIAVALVLPFVVKTTTTRQRISVLTASLGFILFAGTDFLEASTHGRMPLWLWIYKILCASLLLSCRYVYLGWKRFRLTDRYFLFGLFCLLASLVIMFLQQRLDGTGGAPEAIDPPHQG